jgi:glycosyltransferase involved in cell wall biosynthesis
LDYIAPGEHPYTVVEQTEFGTIIRSPYKANLANRLMLKYGERRFRWARKIISGAYELLQWFFIVGPKSGLYRAADEYLKNNKVDAIIATGDPFVLFKYASKLSKKYTIPWIADYRDPWSNNYEKSKFCWLHRFFISIEKKYVHSASAITTVSEFLKYKLAQLHPHLPIHILPNGYDPEAIAQVQQATPPTDRLRFGFVGTIYDWHPWKSVLRVFDTFLKMHSETTFEVNYYGINKENELKDYIKNETFCLQNILQINRKFENIELLKKLTGCHVLILHNDYSILGTKIFDYLGLKRQILLCYSNDEEALQLKQRYYRIEEVEGISQQLQADLIHATNSGIVVKDANHLYEVLENLFREFKTTGTIACHSHGIENYSRLHQVKELAKLVKEVVSRK